MLTGSPFGLGHSAEGSDVQAFWGQKSDEADVDVALQFEIERRGF